MIEAARKRRGSGENEARANQEDFQKKRILSGVTQGFK